MRIVPIRALYFPQSAKAKPCSRTGPSRGGILVACTGVEWRARTALRTAPLRPRTRRIRPGHRAQAEMIQTHCRSTTLPNAPKISRLGNDLPTKLMASVSVSAGVFGIATCDSELPDVGLPFLLSLHEERNPSGASIVNHFNQRLALSAANDGCPAKVLRLRTVSILLSVNRTSEAANR